MSDFNSSFCFCRSSQSLRNRSLWCTGAFSARPRRLGSQGRAEVHIRRCHARNPRLFMFGIHLPSCPFCLVCDISQMNYIDPTEHRCRRWRWRGSSSCPTGGIIQWPWPKSFVRKGFGSGWLRVLWQFGIWNAVACLLGHLLLRKPQISFLQRDHGSRSIKIISALQLLPTHTTWLFIFLNILKSMWFGLIWYPFLCKPLVIRIPGSSPGQRSAQEEQASGKTWTEEEGKAWGFGSKQPPTMISLVCRYL